MRYTSPDTRNYYSIKTQAEMLCNYLNGGKGEV